MINDVFSITKSLLSCKGAAFQLFILLNPAKAGDNFPQHIFRCRACALFISLINALQSFMPACGLKKMGSVIQAVKFSSLTRAYISFFTVPPLLSHSILRL